MTPIDQKCVNALRTLAADAIQKANSGHPGLPLGAAPAAYTLWAEQLKHDPQDPKWADRDRFILSAGHGSALLYSLLHIFGYHVSLDDLKNFRQLGSNTPGHPEYGVTEGVEATTGPLGAGLGLAVGLAAAEKHLAARFNRDNYPVVDHYTYALCGDGCLMEGVSSEALSLAGTLGLNKLIIIYDSNNITIEGPTDLAFTENVQKRMEAFGFQTIEVADGNDLAAIAAAIAVAKAEKARPTFITVHTEIGYGCPAKQGKASAHGEPLGADNVKTLKENLGWPVEDFCVPAEVYEHCADSLKKNAAKRESWQKMFAAYKAEFPELAALWEKIYAAPDAAAIDAIADYWQKPEKDEATRASSGTILNQLKDILPQLIGGSADLGPSNKTVMKDAGDFAAATPEGRNIHFGVREMAMGAIAAGLALHGGILPYAATFFVFSDYLKPMMRLAALMELPVIYVLTHDSIGVGEDGPTHQPIEQLAGLRAMPNLNVIRPVDRAETAAAWQIAVTSTKTPTALVLTRQNLPQLQGSGKDALKGAYVVSPAENPQGIFIATGSEVALAIEAQQMLAAENIAVSVVSVPSVEIFEAQSDEYKESVLPKNIRARVIVEMGSPVGWGSYVGLDGATVTIDHFGASAPYKKLAEKFGFTAANVAATMKKVIENLK